MWGSQSQPSGQQSGASNAPPHIHVTAEVGVSVDNNGQLQGYVKNVSAQTVGEFAGSTAFITHVAAASKAAKSMRQL